MANKENLANGILAADITDTDTQITLDSGSGASDMPSAPFYATITLIGVVSNKSNSEIVYVTDVTGDTLTVVRGQRGTVAKSFPSGSIVANGFYVEDLEDFVESDTTDRFTVSDTEPANPTDGDVWIDTSHDQYTPLIAQLLDKFYPIGTIYYNGVDGTNPGSMFGGIWEPYLQGRVPVGIAEDGTFSVIGTEVGTEEVALTVAQMPSHRHNTYRYPTGGSSVGIVGATNASTGGQTFGSGAPDTSDTGGDQPHNNIQPSKVVYAWIRTE